MLIRFAICHTEIILNRPPEMYKKNRPGTYIKKNTDNHYYLICECMKYGGFLINLL